MENLTLRVAVVAALQQENKERGTLFRIPAFDVYAVSVVRADNGEVVDTAEVLSVDEANKHIMLLPAKEGANDIRVAETLRAVLNNYTGEMVLSPVCHDEVLKSGYILRFELLHHNVTHYGITLDHPLFGMPTEPYDDDENHQRDIVAFNASRIITASDGRGLPVIVYTEWRDGKQGVVGNTDTAFDSSQVGHLLREIGTILCDAGERDAQ